ncbi:TolC family protein [Hyalangium gracile]|uniref:TolC family protein n=1 Tax=Hyalangium gracile TaxID=394092 RepID=UPI001CCB8A7A|nr:TolC family protein [Hyalangium gracile]
MRRTVLGHLVGVGLALAAGTATAQGVPGAAQGAPAPAGQGTSVPTPAGQGASVPVPGTQGGQSATPQAQEAATQDATRSTQQQAQVSEGAPAQAAEPLTLARLVERARRSDARVEEAEAELRRLQALQRQAHWAWFPKFETVVGFGGPTPEAYNDGLGGPPTTEASREGDLNFGTLGVTFRAEVNALLPIYTFGKLTALEKAGDQGPIIGAALRERARDEAGFQAAQAFYGYQLARSGLAQIEDVGKRLEDAGKRINEMLEEESQQVSKIDTYKVNFFRQVVAARLAEARQGQAVALAAIRMLAGAKPDERLEIADVELPLEEEFTPPTLEKALTLADQHRPELTALQAGIAAREQEVLIRERSYYPDLGIIGFARYAYTTNATPQRSPFADDPYNDRSVGIGIAARGTFDIPIKNAQLDQARAELDKLKAQQRLLQAAIHLEVAKVHGELVSALERARAYSEGEKNTRRWATAAYAAFDLGTGDTRELMDAFTALAQASAERAKGWFDVRVGIEALNRVTGTPPSGP